MNEIQMQYFCKAAELEHISNAAKELFISQPTLTATIHRIEEECGFPLFIRKGRNIVLTDEGRKIYAGVRRVLEEQEALQTLIRSCRENRQTVVEIVAPPFVITSDIIKKIHSTDPQITLQISRIIDVTADFVAVPCQGGEGRFAPSGMAVHESCVFRSRVQHLSGGFRRKFRHG